MEINNKTFKHGSKVHNQNIWTNLSLISFDRIKYLSVCSMLTSCSLLNLVGTFVGIRAKFERRKVLNIKVMDWYFGMWCDWDITCSRVTLIEKAQCIFDLKRYGGTSFQKNNIHWLYFHNFNSFRKSSLWFQDPSFGFKY